MDRAVLIANRGEIAIRVARTCKRLGFRTVGVYSAEDHDSEHIRYCDEAYLLGPAAPRESYLNIERIIEVAKQSGAKWIHPGYGFLSERAEFVRACERAGLIFIGPSAEVMEQMGDKISARQVIDQLKVPRVPGSKGAVNSVDEAAKIANELKYPILLKAAAGGGGKGMRRVDHEGELKTAFDAAKREALAAFGDDALYLEKLILSPHHIEVQVFGDGKGGAVHIGERECSIQRRHQKIWEESPSPLMEKFSQKREALFENAIRITSFLKYAGAGTLEFVADEEGNCYFLEMNTRLQVEHPVSEWVSGIDLVEWQVRLVADAAFSLPHQDEIKRTGASIEARIYAEDPENFLPAPGPIGLIEAPSGPFVRWDAGIRRWGRVPMDYDPMIAKLSTWGIDREAALGRLRVALTEIRIEPPIGSHGLKIGSMKTNLSLLRRLCHVEEVRAGETSTDLIPNHPELKSLEEKEVSIEQAVAVSIFQLLDESLNRREEALGARARGWSLTSLQESVRK